MAASGPDVEERAKRAGASKVVVIDGRETFVREFVLPALKAGAIYEGVYPLATALGRPLIAQYLVEVAEQEGAGIVAHGCTGKGNDQVRFERQRGCSESIAEGHRPGSRVGHDERAGS